MSPNEPKWTKMGHNGQKGTKKGPKRDQKGTKKGPKRDQKGTKMAQNELKWIIMDQNSKQ